MGEARARIKREWPCTRQYLHSMLDERDIQDGRAGFTDLGSRCEEPQRCVCSPDRSRQVHRNRYNRRGRFNIFDLLLVDTSPVGACAGLRRAGGRSYCTVQAAAALCSMCSQTIATLDYSTLHMRTTKRQNDRLLTRQKGYGGGDSDGATMGKRVWAGGPGRGLEPPQDPLGGVQKQVAGPPRGGWPGRPSDALSSNEADGWEPPSSRGEVCVPPARQNPVSP